jgi:hypothetical protein
MPEHSDNFFGHRIEFRIAGCQTKNGLAPLQRQLPGTEQEQMFDLAGPEYARDFWRAAVEI